MQGSGKGGGPDIMPGIMDDLRTSLQRALASQFGVRVPVGDDTELFSKGLVDSLSVVDLVTFVESHVGRPIPPVDITLDNFDTISRIVRYTQRLMKSG